MADPLWRISGLGRQGPFTIQVRAPDYASAVRKAPPRNVRIDTVALVEPPWTDADFDLYRAAVALLLPAD
jgi:hypothetical protein